MRTGSLVCVLTLITLPACAPARPNNYPVLVQEYISQYQAPPPPEPVVLTEDTTQPAAVDMNNSSLDWFY